MLRTPPAARIRMVRSASSVALATIAAASFLAEAAPAGIGGRAPAGKVRAWTPQFIGAGAEPTRLEALADARSFPAIVAHAPAYKDHVAAMKAANPRLTLLVYMNATATWEADLAERAYAHDALGNRIRIREWSFTYLLDPSSPAAISYQQRRAAALLAASGYDGLYLDALGPSSLRLDYVTALPVNPVTGAVWTRARWLAATASLAARVREAISTRPLVGNGLAGGAAYFLAGAPTERLLDSGLHGGVAESWVHATKQSIAEHAPVSVWKQDVDMLRDASLRGVSVLTLTKVWAPGTRAQKRAWHRFAVASYLLGNAGHSYLGFSYAPGDFTVARRLHRLNLGRALGKYMRVRGYYVRAFRRGRVYVNPGSGMYRISLTRRHKTLSGRWVTSVTLRPHSAHILRR